MDSGAALEMMVDSGAAPEMGVRFQSSSGNQGVDSRAAPENDGRIPELLWNHTHISGAALESTPSFSGAAPEKRVDFRAAPEIWV